MVTPKQLVAELDRRGYHVTERQIKDWRDKELLPPLSRYGKGRGSGALFCWENESVVDQAIAVYELLGRRARTTDAMLGLWFIGYPMEPKTIKWLWLARLKRSQNGLLHGAIGREAVDDKLSSLSAKLANSQAKQYGIVHGNLESLVTEFVSALLNPCYSVSDDDIWELESAANTFLAAAHRSEEPPITVTIPSLKRALTFTRQYLSVDSALNLVASVTDAELENAHRRWRSVIQLIVLLTTKAHSEMNSEELAQMGRQAGAMLGGWCVLVMLHLGRHRKGRLVDFWVKRIEQEARSRYFDPSTLELELVQPE